MDEHTGLHYNIVWYRTVAILLTTSLNLDRALRSKEIWESMRLFALLISVATWSATAMAFMLEIVPIAASSSRGTFTIAESRASAGVSLFETYNGISSWGGCTTMVGSGSLSIFPFGWGRVSYLQCLDDGNLGIPERSPFVSPPKVGQVPGLASLVSMVRLTLWFYRTICVLVSEGANIHRNEFNKRRCS